MNRKTILSLVDEIIMHGWWCAQNKDVDVDKIDFLEKAE